MKDYPTSAKLVDSYLLPRIETESSLAELRRHTDQVRQQLVHLPEIEQSLVAFEALEKRLQRLREALEGALEADRVAAETQTLFDGLKEKALGALATARSVHTAATDASANARKELEASQSGYAAARLAREAAVLRDARKSLLAAEHRAKETGSALQIAKERCDSLEALSHLLEAERRRAEAQALDRQIAASAGTVDDLLKERECAVARLASGLDRLLAQERQTLAQARDAMDAAHRKDQESQATLRRIEVERAGVEAEQKEHERWLEHARRALAEAGFPDIAAARRSAADSEQAEHDARLRKDEAAASAQKARDTARDAEKRASHSEIEAERAKSRLKEVESLCERESAERAALEEMLAALELADPHAEGGDALGRLAAQRAELEQEQQAIRARLKWLAEELEYFESHGLLRPDEDVEAVARALQKAGIHAELGPRYLKAVPGLGEAQRLEILHRHPGLVAGFVLETAQVDRLARQFAQVTERLVLRSPVFLFRRDQIIDGAGSPVFEVPAHPSFDRFVDPQAAARAVDAMRAEEAERRDTEATRSTALRRVDGRIGRLQRYLADWPQERVHSIRDEAEQARGAAGKAQSALLEAKEAREGSAASRGGSIQPGARTGAALERRPGHCHEARVAWRSLR
ncbi:MAG: hypothetical protein QM765_39120 [Myxococcales bacterium]